MAFFFSSRRRHTRLQGDWSSDVCSSDLGREVAVKVLRPRVEEGIAKDVALLETAAALAERLWPEARRLKPRQVVAEFEHHLEEELDLLREAANASQLRRNFLGSSLLVVPEVY